MKYRLPLVILAASAGAASTACDSHSSAVRRTDPPHDQVRPEQRANSETADRVEAQFEALVAAPPNFSIPDPIRQYTHVFHKLTNEEIMAFVEVGAEAVPVLIRHVRDPDLTLCSYTSPYSSMFVSNDMMTAGRLAMFLLEAVRHGGPRDQYKRQIGPPLLFAANPRERGSGLAKRADAHEKWFEACYDSETGGMRRSTDCVPIVEGRKHEPSRSR
ncbi:MAG: hypothetical protein JSV78_00590 [Phycisphaerales bacterium]|nr:MAG: hypothetical protein JSV78_00590 [Phycisphaerales bacterium]